MENEICIDLLTPFIPFIYLYKLTVIEQVHM